MNKTILTGGPGTGKSSILLALEMSGYQVIREAAEDVIKYNKAQGNAEPWKNLPAFQDQILKLQQVREYAVRNSTEPVFIDRGVLDGLAYYELSGTEPSQMMAQAVEQHRENGYGLILLVDSLGECKHEGFRREDLEESRRISDRIEKIYRHNGYHIEHIKPGTVYERKEQVLKNMRRWRLENDERD
jgi:predicted ATPase